MVIAGNTWTFWLTVSNLGPSDAEHVTVAATLPPGTAFLSQSQLAGSAFQLGGHDQEVRNTIAALSAGTAASFRIVAQIELSVPDLTTLYTTGTATTRILTRF